MKLINRFVQKNLKLNRKRTLVTVIGIILSVALLSALSTMVASFQKSLVEYQKQKAGDFHVAFYGVEDGDLDIFDHNRGIESYYTIYEEGYSYLKDSTNENKPYCRLLSMEEKAMEGARLSLISGRLPKNEKEIVIPRHLKTNGRVDLKIGETITLELGSRVEMESQKELSADTAFLGTEKENLINCNQKTFEIVGIIERPNYGVEAYQCPGYSFITYGKGEGKKMGVFARLKVLDTKDTAKLVAGILGVNPELMVKSETDPQFLNNMEWEELLRQLHKSRFNFYVNSWLMTYEKVWPPENTMSVLYTLAFIVICIIIVTSVYCIKNSFDISISEKIRQYGMLSSVGATRKQIKKSVHTEAAYLGILGIPLGILSGLFASFVLLKISNMLLKGVLGLTLIFSPSLGAVLLAAALGILTVYLSAAGSARKAAKVSPMEAIRNQREIKLSSKNVKTPAYVGKIWGIGGVIAYKNWKRNKRKYRTTVVSIVICTITFLVVSYFMSMGMDLVSTDYTEEGYSLSLSFHSSTEQEVDVSFLDQVENKGKFSIVRENYIDEVKAGLTQEYQSLFASCDIEYEGIRLLALDEESFERYAKECGIKKSQGKVILVNTTYVMWEEEGKVRQGELNVFDLKSGQQLILSDEDTENVVVGENDEVIEVPRVEYEVTVDLVTEKRPMGFKGIDEGPLLVMSQETAKDKNILLNPYYYCYFDTGQPDKLQDDLEKEIKEMEVLNYGFNNRAKSQREEKSLFLLLDIFAYGLITVIALIGVTNIVNTLSTGVDLRSRELATLRSVGMTRAQFHKMVLLESVFTSARSLIWGVGVGMGISYLIYYAECSYDKVIPFHPPIIPAIISIAVVIVLIYAILGTSMKRILQKNVIETIKNENL